MEALGEFLARAGDKVLEGGPWAALSIILLVCCGWMVRAILKEGALNREAHIGTATAMTRFSQLLEEIRRGMKL